MKPKKSHKVEEDEVEEADDDGDDDDAGCLSNGIGPLRQKWLNTVPARPRKSFWSFCLVASWTQGFCRSDPVLFLLFFLANGYRQQHPTSWNTVEGMIKVATATARRKFLEYDSYVSQV